jgi:hypothetical protein
MTDGLKPEKADDLIFEILRRKGPLSLAQIAAETVVLPGEGLEEAIARLSGKGCISKRAPDFPGQPEESVPWGLSTLFL